MRKTIIIIAAAGLMLCVSLLTGYNTCQKPLTLDPLLLENIQALAEITVFERACFKAVEYDPVEEEEVEEGEEGGGWIMEVVYCGTCDWVPATSASKPGEC